MKSIVDQWVSRKNVCTPALCDKIVYFCMGQTCPKVQAFAIFPLGYISRRRRDRFQFFLFNFLDQKNSFLNFFVWCSILISERPFECDMKKKIEKFKGALIDFSKFCFMSHSKGLSEMSINYQKKVSKKFFLVKKIISILSVGVADLFMRCKWIA